MFRFSLCLMVFAATCRAAEDGDRIFEQIRRAVAAQVTRTGNYTCIQTIDRTYYEGPRSFAYGCDIHSGAKGNREVMHDRLRLDVAVSEGREIFSWHGGRNFSTGGISEIVPSGPISSGSFVGYLRNIFLTPGVQVKYLGRHEVNGVALEKFDYSVPLASSHHLLQSLHRSHYVPYQGSFAANAEDFELVSLSVQIDPPPDSDSSICSAEIDMNYGSASISNKQSLIPRLFTLRIVDASRIYTVSRSDYAQCREFRGESTLRFDTDETAGTNEVTDTGEARLLPAGLRLLIRLHTPIDSNTAFTGDPVEGLLLNQVKLRNGVQIGKGAVLKGVINLLEQYYRPEIYYLVSIEFDELIAGRQRFRLKAVPELSRQDANKLGFIFGRRLPPQVAMHTEKGVLVEATTHLHLDEHFSGEWLTIRAPASESGNEANPANR